MNLIMATPRSARAIIAELGATQHLAFRADQALVRGVSGDVLAGGVRRGELHTPLPRTYVIGPPDQELSRTTREMVAVLWGGERSRLTGEGAAIAREIWPEWRRVEQRVHIRVPQPHGTSPVDWLVAFRTRHDLQRETTGSIHGIVTADTTRTILDLGRSLTAYQIAAVMDRARFTRRLDLPSLENYLAAHRHEPYTRVVRAAVQLHQDLCLGTKSPAEDAFLAAIEVRGYPIPSVNQVAATSIAGLVVDFVWMKERVIVEIDGRPHQDDPNRIIDEGRDEMLRAHGWLIIRIPAWRVRCQLDQVMEELGAVLAARQ